MAIEHKLETMYLRCDECFGQLEEVYDEGYVEKYIYKTNWYIKCKECGKKFKGYECSIDNEGNIVNFKLISY